MHFHGSLFRMIFDHAAASSMVRRRIRPVSTFRRRHCIGAGPLKTEPSFTQARSLPNNLRRDSAGKTPPSRQPRRTALPDMEECRVFSRIESDEPTTHGLLRGKKSAILAWFGGLLPVASIGSTVATSSLEARPVIHPILTNRGCGERPGQTQNV
jgi:hypothetical protein